MRGSEQRPAAASPFVLQCLSQLRPVLGCRPEALDVAMEGRGEIWRSEAIEQDLQVEINGTATLSASVPVKEIEMIVENFDYRRN